MPQQLDLAELFGSIAQELETDRSYLNGLDGRNKNAGDNMARNFRIVSEALSHQRGQGDDRDALMQAAQVLREEGRGKTASLYASGLQQAASNLPQGSLTIDDLLPLLEGLLGGVQQASGAQQGQGTLLDALIPGVLGYMQAKQRGASEMEAILDALASARRGTYGGYAQQPGAQAPQEPGLHIPQRPGAQVPQQPSVDPGAAGVGSLLEGLFRSVLRGLSSGQSDSGGDTTPPSKPRVYV